MMSTVITKDGLGRVVDLHFLCLVQQLLENAMEFFSMPNLVTENVRQLVDREVDLFLINGVALVALIKLERLDFGIQGLELLLEVAKHGVQLAVVLHDPAKDDVPQQEDEKNKQHNDTDHGTR
jgi:hypothetical protein